MRWLDDSGEVWFPVLENWARLKRSDCNKFAGWGKVSEPRVNIEALAGWPRI